MFQCFILKSERAWYSKSHGQMSQVEIDRRLLCVGGSKVSSFVSAPIQSETLKTGNGPEDEVT